MSKRHLFTVYPIYILIPFILWTQSMPQHSEKVNGLKTSDDSSLSLTDLRPTEKSNNETNNIVISSTESQLKKTANNQQLTANVSTSTADAKPKNSFTFMVSIQIKENGKFKHQCGGAIISKHFVLTAAHCTLKPRQLKAKDLYVVGGHKQLFHKNATRFRVQTMKKHSKFVPLHGSDILLLQVVPEIPIDNIKFSTIEFRDATRKNEDLEAMLIGWGQTKPNKPKDLESVPFRTISDEDCFIKNKFRYLTESEICAVNSGGNRGACDGDSGGPLIDLKQQSLYGILSYGRKPCQSGKPYAFTRTSVFVKWIEEQMENMLRLCTKKDNKV